MPSGRKKIWKDEFIEIAGKAAREGNTMVGIGKSIGVGKRKLYEWMKEHPQLEEAVNSGRDYFDTRVAEASLAKRVKGFTYTVKREVLDRDGQKHVLREQRKVLPDVTACIFWLKNRRGDRWRDVHNLEIEGGDGLEERLRKAHERLRKQSDKE